MHNIPDRALLVASGKGGVGKSTITALLGVSLAQLGYQVNLLDADLTGPSQPTIFGLEGLPPPIHNGVPMPFNKYGVNLLSYGNFIPYAEPVTMRGPLLTAALTKLIKGVIWPKSDVFLIDMPPTTSDLSLTCIQAIAFPSVLLITQGDALSLSDARRAANHYFSLNVPIIGVIESKSDHDGYNSSVQALSDSLEIPFLGKLPYYNSIHEKTCSGLIAELINQSRTEGQLIRQITQNLLERPEYRHLALT